MARKFVAKSDKPFSVEIAFTGICAVVPNGDGASANRYCVAVPDGRSGGDDARFFSIDGSRPLRRHRCFIQFGWVGDDRAIERPMPMSLLWYPDGHSITVDNDKDTKAIEDLGEADWDKAPAKDTPGTSAAWLAHLDGPLGSGQYELDERVVAGSMARDGEFPGVAARFFLSAGSLGAGYVSSHAWEFVEPRSGQIYAQRLAKFVVYQLGRREAFSLSADDGSGDDLVVALPARTGDVLRVSVYNVCDDNPLGWGPAREATLDEDFAWYYTLLSEETKRDIRAALLGRALPLPRPNYLVGDIGGGPGSGNCIPTRTKAYRF